MSTVQKDLFSGMELGKVDDPMEDYADFDTIYLSEQINGDKYSGKPIMVEPFSFEIFDEKQDRDVTKHKFRLCIIDQGAEEYLEIGINLKKEGDIQKNVRKGSVLFDLLAGLMEKKDPGSMEGFNVFKQVDLSSIRDFVNSLELMTVEVVEKTGKFNFNTIKVIDIR